MSEHMKDYRAMSKPPKWALRTIGAGRLKGKSDINPQWRYEALTEVYGPCGIGWKYTIDKLWTVDGSDNQVFAFANISLFVKKDGEWSEPIPANGGNMLVVKESRGPHCNDEAFKMAITDALGNASKMLGVAAEIFRGTFNTKHEFQESLTAPKTKNDKPKAPMKPEKREQAQAMQDDDNKRAAMRKEIARLAKDATQEQLDKIAKIKNGVGNKDLSVDQLKEIKKVFNKPKTLHGAMNETA